MEQSQIADMICCKCQVPLVSKEIKFHYLGFNFNTPLPCCPVCGQVFVSEDLVRGRMREVELSLEDK